jgi:hypothetical protein
MADVAKSRRFEFLWLRERWIPETAQLIQAWGDRLAALQDELLFRKRPRRKVLEHHLEALDKLKRSTTRATVVRAPEAARELDEGIWLELAHAVRSCAGMRQSSLEDLAIALVKRGLEDLALGLISIEEFFEPGDRGIARHHIEALAGRRKEAVRALVRLIWEPGRSWHARVRALACLGELDGEAFEDEAKWILGVAASEGEDIATWEIRNLMERYDRPGARKAS